MKNHEFIIIFLLLIAVVSDAGLTSAAGKSLSKPLPLNSTLYKHSHEELHSKSDSATSFSPNISSINVSKPQHQDQSIKTSVPHQQLDGEMLSKPNIVKVTPEPTKSANVSAPTPKHGKVIIAEGGVEVSSQYPLGNKGNETRNNKTTVNTVTPNPSNTSKMFDLPVNLTTPGINITQIHKRIHGRPGVSEVVTPSTTTIKSSSTTTLPPRPRKKKPQFTMITGDKESKDSESFIESSTTGRDYVLPIVLIILSLPIVGYLIKIIYRRGTEFTERQQYHRMYLIDGMYNSR